MTPKRFASAIGTSIVASVTAAPRSSMQPQHARVVHLVDVIARQHHQVRGFSRMIEYRFW